MKHEETRTNKLDEFLMQLTYFFVMRIGITWNNILVPIIFGSLPGVAIWLGVLFAISVLGNYFKISETFIDYIFHPFVLILSLLYLGYNSIKKYNKRISVKDLTMARFEYKGQGYVIDKKPLSQRSERDVGQNFQISEFAMIDEGERCIPWYVSVSEITIPAENVPLQFTTDKITTSSQNGVQIECLFTERYHVTNAGIYFNIAPQNQKHELKKETLTNAVLDLIQKLDDATILWLSGKQIKKILLEPIFYYEKTSDGENKKVNSREIIKKSKEEDYARDKDPGGAQKVIQDFYQSKQMWLELEKAQGKLTEDEEKEESEKISLEFTKFKDAIVSSIGRIKHTNDRFGIFTDDIIQKEMNYGSAEVRKAAEQKMMAEAQAKADSIRIDWLNETMKKVQDSWKDGSMSAKEALHTIQVEFGKRAGYSFDGNKDVNTMFPIK